MNELQNSELLEQLNRQLKEIVKFNFRGVTESGTQVNIRQIQLNDIAYEIKIVPTNRKVVFNDVPLHPKKRKVNMYELATGNFVKEFDGTFEAQYHENVKGFNQAMIERCCNGLTKKVSDYIFLWSNESSHQPLKDDIYIDRFGMGRVELLYKITKKLNKKG